MFISCKISSLGRRFHKILSRYYIYEEKKFFIKLQVRQMELNSYNRTFFYINAKTCFKMPLLHSISNRCYSNFTFIFKHLKKSFLFTAKKNSYQTHSIIIPLESALVITENAQLSEMVKGALKSLQRGKNHDLDESSKGYMHN